MVLSKETLEKINRHKNVYCYCAIAIYLLINNSVCATSAWFSESQTANNSILVGELLLQEYSNGLSVFLLLPVLFYLFKRVSRSVTGLKKQALTHIVIAVLFAVVQTSLLNSLLAVGYSLLNGSDTIKPITAFGFNELQRGVWNYCFFLCLFHVFNFIYHRLQGEASLVTQQSVSEQESVEASASEHFLIKKLNKEFLIKIEEIEWLESSGNYVNLHVNNRIFPLRGTLSQLSERLQNRGFTRIHRRYTVNHNSIDSIEYNHSGDGDVTLKSGVKLNLSRRYKEQFKQKLG